MFVEAEATTRAIIPSRSKLLFVAEWALDRVRPRPLEGLGDRTSGRPDRRKIEQCLRVMSVISCIFQKNRWAGMWPMTIQMPIRRPCLWDSSVEIPANAKGANQINCVPRMENSLRRVR